MDHERLADFLRRRRHALRPADLGFETGPRRRATGLRREEVAELANISANFYTKLEQRRGSRPSEQTLHAMARALQLTQDERDYLLRLAGRKAPPRARRTDTPSPGLMRVLERLDTPAQIVSDLGVTLRQNRLAEELRGVQVGRTGLERSMIFRWFTSREERQRIAADEHEWHSRKFTAHLRAIHARDPDDPEANALVESLRRRSPEFAKLWDLHEVGVINTVKKRICTAAGVIAFDCQVLASENQVENLVVFTVAPDSEDAARLAFLRRKVEGVTA